MLEQKVFIIDDDDAVRDSIKEIVESIGLTAETFASAQSFLDSYSVDEPGCLVLDVRMARMGGGCFTHSRSDSTPWYSSIETPFAATHPRRRAARTSAVSRW